MAEFELMVPIGGAISFLVVAGVVFLFARKLLSKVIMNSVLGVVALVLLNMGGFSLSYSLVNLGLVAALGLAGLVVVIILKLAGVAT